MPTTKFLPCIPTRGTNVPSGPDWLHEIKHDGYRLIVQREGNARPAAHPTRIRLVGPLPLIVEAALRLRKTSFVIDGEAVVLGPDGISDFDALHGGRRNADVRLYAFDLLSDEGVDMRDETLRIRKLWLGKLLSRSGDGIIINDHHAAEGVGPLLYRQACLMGLEGIVSKHQDSAYRPGRSARWIKVKNPTSAAMTRAKDIKW